MLGKILGRWFGTDAENRRFIDKNLRPVLEQVRTREAAHAAMSNDELRAQTLRFREQLSQGASLDDILPDAFAAAREAAKRVAGMRPFDVQIMGGIALHTGKIAEMFTGEGKTLVATLPIYLNALDGKGVHLVTVNDYLARRDREWMGPIFEFMGLTVGLIQHDMAPSERKVGYRADITYGTNSEFGFDYLRDNMAVRPEMRSQRLLNYAIIDEVDSILIDEARTPLIISGRQEKPTEVYYKVDDAVRRLRKEEHYEVEEKNNQVMLTDEGMEFAEKQLDVENIFSQESLGLVHMLEQSIRAHEFYKKDDEYVVKDGHVLIVDEFTGRILAGRRYSDGLHQAIEAKERVPVQFESQTIATITYQNYFRLYNKIAGMTGTAMTEAMEFSKIYDLEVVSVPTNLPLIREDGNDLVFATELGKFKHVTNEIKELHQTGRPVLVGTVSIEKSELVAKLLEENGINDYEVLNAKHHEREASIVANAGKRGAITIATNMAGRGTDIKLGEGVREVGGLAIIGTERHESRRIDNQLRGRCGRQGDPGTTQFFLSLQDEVARLFGGDRVKRVLDFVGADYMDDEPLSQGMVSKSIERAQRQVEEHHYKSREHLKEYDDVMDRQRRYIYGLRTEVLEDRDVTGRVDEMFENAAFDIAGQYAPEEKLPEDWDIEGLETRFNMIFGFTPRTQSTDQSAHQPLPEDLVEQVRQKYKQNEDAIAEEIRNAYRERIGGDEDKINFQALARKRVHEYELMAILRAVDDKWIDHLYSMDYLKQSVRLRAYGQSDPLIEYKRESFEMFQGLIATIEESVIQTLFRITDPEIRKRRHMVESRSQEPMQDDPFQQLSQYSYIAADKQQDRSFASFDTSRFALAGQAAAGREEEEGGVATEARPKPAPIRNLGPQTGPNDPCTCGSGKKYKKCCGKLG